MSTEGVDDCLLNGSAPVHSSMNIVQQSSSNTDVFVGQTDDWPEDKVTRKARKDSTKMSFCPPLPAARIQHVFGENPECLPYIAEDASALSEVANTHRCTQCREKDTKKGAHFHVLPGAEYRFGYGTDGRPLLPQGSFTDAKSVCLQMALLK